MQKKLIIHFCLVGFYYHCFKQHECSVDLNFNFFLTSLGSLPIRSQEYLCQIYLALFPQHAWQNRS